GTPEFTAHGAPVAYEVTLEPHNKRWLFALDVPGKVPPHAFASADFQLYAVQPVINRIRYEMTSFLDYSYGLPEDSIAIRRALARPGGMTRQTIAVGGELRAQSPDDRALVQAVLGKFRNERFSYTLTPPLLGPDDPVDQFLFETRSGFCEHYSSAF